MVLVEHKLTSLIQFTPLASVKLGIQCWNSSAVYERDTIGMSLLCWVNTDAYKSINSTIRPSKNDAKEYSTDA